MNIAIKRIYDPWSEQDGLRLLVDRLWPRGISKEAARIDLWLKDMAPSAELRKEFHNNPEKWQEFKRRYREELGRYRRCCGNSRGTRKSGNW